MPINTRQDDGYRGWLRNPRTGREFKANHVTAIRGDLDRISGPGAKAKVSKGEDSVKKEDPPETAKEPEVTNTPDPQSTADQGEANEMLADLLKQAENTDDRAALKGIGAQIGLSLTMNMSEKTMRGRIAKQIESIKAAGE